MIKISFTKNPLGIFQSLMNYNKIQASFLILHSFIFFSSFFSINTYGEEPRIYIKMGNAVTKKSVVALPNPIFTGTPSLSPGHKATGAEIVRILQNDLLATTYFQFLSQAAFLEDDSNTRLIPFPQSPDGFKFDSWKQIGAEFLIKSAFSFAGEELTLETYTYQVEKKELVLGKKYTGKTKDLRRIIHKFGNELMKALTGIEGMFLSKIVVASDRDQKKFREIFVMDWDGFNIEKITNHKSVSMSPTWSPDAQKIAYTAFVQRSQTKTRNADLFVYDTKNETRKAVSFKKGINSGAFFDPSGTSIFLTLTEQGNPDIFKIDLDGKVLRRITNGPRNAMNIEPAISPDGKKIAFSSDRSGKPMLYVANIDGSNEKRLTFLGTFNSSPAWSPDGSKLAFAGWSDDHFDIFTMNIDGSGLLRITSARKPNGKWSRNEDPSFSPDGRLLIYTSNRTGNDQIYISNLDGSEERRITSDNNNYFKPKWSKNIE